MTQPQHDCGLYLAIEGGALRYEASFLDAVLGAGHVACVLFEAAGWQGSSNGIDALRDAVQCVQSHEVAALVADDAEIARNVGADGVHLSESADLEFAIGEARNALGDGAIVGVHAGASKHQAMMAGELGADYVALEPGEQFFGESLIGWWAAVVEVPCVAWGATDSNQARRFAEDGADFVMLRLEASLVPEHARDLVSKVSAVLRA